MAASKFFFLDSVGIDESFLLNQDLDSNILSNKIFNLSFNNFQTQVQFEQHQKAITDLLKSKTSITFRDFNLVIESFLVHLLSTSTISNLEKTKLSPHFSKYKQLKLEHLSRRISNEYLENLTFTNARVWGGQYGSPLYFLYLDGEEQHYLHPSQIVEIVINALAKSSTSTFSSIYSQLASLSLSEEPAVDQLIYKVPIDFLNTLPEFEKAYSTLIFLSEWLPKLLNWYLEPFLTQNAELKPATKAEEHLQEIAKRCLYYGLDAYSFSEDLAFQWIHQDLSVPLISLFEDILALRKSATIDPQEPLNDLFSEFIENIDLNTPPNLIRETSLTLLRELAPPGGYNLLLLIVSLSLLNKAFILSHPVNNPYSDLSIFPLEVPLDPVLQLIGRVFRLIYAAGFTLSKSNLEHLNVTGFNLMTLTNLYDDPPISSKNLML